MEDDGEVSWDFHSTDDQENDLVAGGEARGYWVLELGVLEVLIDQHDETHETGSLCPLVELGISISDAAQHELLDGVQREQRFKSIEEAKATALKWAQQILDRVQGEIRALMSTPEEPR